MSGDDLVDDLKGDDDDDDDVGGILRAEIADDFDGEERSEDAASCASVDLRGLVAVPFGRIPDLRTCSNRSIITCLADLGLMSLDGFLTLTSPDDG